MNRRFTACLIVLLACGAETGEQDAALNDTTSAAAPVDSAADPREPARAPGPLVDAQRVQVGSDVAGLRVARKQIDAAPASRLGVSGSLAFEGEIQLTGGYRAHFDYPDVKEPCFWVDPADWARLPRVQGDDRIKWFCFENAQDAIRQLGELGTETRATIVVDDYTTNLRESDVWDSARLVRVISKQKLP